MGGLWTFGLVCAQGLKYGKTLPAVSDREGHMKSNAVRQWDARNRNMKNVLAVTLLLVLLSGCGPDAPPPAAVSPQKQLESLYKAGRAVEDLIAKGGDIDAAEFNKLNAAMKAEIEAFGGRSAADKQLLGKFVTAYSKVSEIYDIASTVLDLSARLQECKAKLTPRECHTQFEAESSGVAEKMLAATALRGTCMTCDPTAKATATSLLARALDLHQSADRRLTGIQPAQ